MPHPTPEPAEWTTLALAVHGFGWTGPRARGAFRRAGLILPGGRPVDALVHHGVARQRGRKWEWHTARLGALLQHLGVEPMGAIDHAAWWAVEQFTSNIRRARRMEARGGNRHDVMVFTVAASAALISGKPRKGDPQRMEKLHALSRAMYLGGLDEAFQERMWESMGEDPAQAMAGSRALLLDDSTGKAGACAATRRL